jgi:hypothetical protein
LELPSVAPLDVNRAYCVNPPKFSVGAHRSSYVPVYALRSFYCACRITIEEISGKGAAFGIAGDATPIDVWALASFL